VLLLLLLSDGKRMYLLRLQTWVLWTTKILAFGAAAAAAQL
jgi:hypothetical protein